MPLETLRYHNRNADGFIFVEFMIQGEGRFHANEDMGFVEVPDTETARAHMKSLHLDPFEHEPRIPVAIADPRLIEQHSQIVGALNNQIDQLQSEVGQLRMDMASAKTERDAALADKKLLLEKYDRAVTKVAERIEAPVKVPYTPRKQ
jgi:outer membrane murein-binding lipoprotein Lpp